MKKITAAMIFMLGFLLGEIVTLEFIDIFAAAIRRQEINFTIDRMPYNGQLDEFDLTRNF